jgi:hypothetical protein
MKLGPPELRRAARRIEGVPGRAEAALQGPQDLSGSVYRVLDTANVAGSRSPTCSLLILFRATSVR